MIRVRSEYKARAPVARPSLYSTGSRRYRVTGTDSEAVYLPERYRMPGPVSESVSLGAASGMSLLGDLKSACHRDYTRLRLLVTRTGS